MPPSGRTSVSLTVVATAFAGLRLSGCGLIELCGGSANLPCPEGKFCKQSPGVCDNEASLGLCMVEPEICTEIFFPVCGCDGTTYSNPCMADASGVSLDHFGECGAPCCDPGAEPGVGGNPACFEGAACCADGQWQCNFGDGSSSCEMNGGVCEKVCGGIAGLPCGEGEFCRLNIGECCCDFQGVCEPIPDACIEIFAPVCGCDGQTYSNECIARQAGVSVDHEGECMN